MKKNIFILFTIVLILVLLAIIYKNQKSENQNNLQVPNSPSGVLKGTELPFIGRIQTRKSEDIKSSQWGVSAHWIADEYPKELSVSDRLEMISSIGAKWAFLCPDWDAIEQKKGEYNWNTPSHHLDDVVNGLHKRKINQVIQIYGGNHLYMPLGPDPNKRQLASAKALISEPEVREAYLSFVKAMVNRYKDNVNVWEIWNEPNSAYFWESKPTALEYGEVVKITAEAVRTIQPGAVIIAGSTALPDYSFLEGFLNGKDAGSFDYWSVHPYGELPEASDSAIIRLKQLLRENNKSDKIWQSECGFPSDPNTGGWGFGGPWNETKHAKWLLRRFLCDAINEMPVSIYFVLYDYPARLEAGPEKGEMGMNRKGLYHSETWKRKKAANTFANLSALIDGRFQFLPDSEAFNITTGSESGEADNELIKKCILRDRETGRNMYLYWLGLPIETEFEARKVRVSLPEKLSDPVLVDLLDGGVYEISSLLETNSQTMRDIPITDSPLILCNRDMVDITQ